MQADTKTWTHYIQRRCAKCEVKQTQTCSGVYGLDTTRGRTLGKTPAGRASRGHPKMKMVVSSMHQIQIFFSALFNDSMVSSLATAVFCSRHSGIICQALLGLALVLTVMQESVKGVHSCMTCSGADQGLTQWAGTPEWILIQECLAWIQAKLQTGQHGAAQGGSI